ncbi:sodium/solute symporter [Opitutales bacterium]|nr:sodium/solute symporter [Opitutales bacterium]
MSQFLSRLLVVFLVTFVSAKAAEGPSSFFGFTVTPAAESSGLLSADSRAVLISPSFEIAAGIYQISGQQVSRVDATGSVSLPDLPFLLDQPSGALIDGRLYVAGGSTLFVLNLAASGSAWVELAALPLATEGEPALAGLHGILYLAGAGVNGTQTFSYDPSQDRWSELAAAPQDLRGYLATACGNDHILYFNGQVADDVILAYHRTTDTWFAMGQLPSALQVLAVGSKGTEFTLFSAESTVSGEALLRPTKYGWVDHSVVAVLVCLLVGVGVYFSNKEKSSGDYFRGGQRIPWWAAGLSLFATGASAISLMAMPGKSFAENWIYFSGAIFVVMIQLPLLMLVYIPVARRLKISTANEYLERRFSLPVRMLGFVCFSLNQMLGRMAAILLLPALAISAIFGMPMEYSILIMGVVTTLFVTMGGLEAVIWTDVLQAVIMLLAVVVCAVYAFSALDMSVPVAFDLLGNLDKLQMFDWRIDWQAPVVIVIFLNTFVSVLGMIGDQNFIQRVQCTHDEKESRKAVYTQLAVAVPMNFVLFALGTLLFLFYVTRADTLSPALKADGVFPFFAAQNLPAGMAGFVVVALLAATISTVSSAMNSVANLGVEDVYRRFFPKVSDHQCLVFGRRLTLGLGIFGTVAALLLANTSGLQSIWDLFLMITGVVLAPITGIFVLGIFSRRVNTFGVWAGTAASVVANYYAKFHLDLHAMVYLIVGVFTCLIVGWLASFLAPPPPQTKVHGLTIFTLKDAEGE